MYFMLGLAITVFCVVLYLDVVLDIIDKIRSKK